MCVVAPVSIILGVGTAIYLEEYAKKNKLNDFIRMNISNLSWCSIRCIWFIRFNDFCSCIMHLEIVF